jgi:hypothetical protein
MIGELQLESGNIVSLILLGIILALGVYVYLELKNIRRELALLKGPDLKPITQLGAVPVNLQGNPHERMMRPMNPTMNQSVNRTFNTPAPDNEIRVESQAEPSLVKPNSLTKEMSQVRIPESLSGEHEAPLEEDSILDLQKIMESEEGVLGSRETFDEAIVAEAEAGGNVVTTSSQDNDDNDITDITDIVGDNEEDNKDIRLISADSPESKYQAMTVSELKDILLEHNLPLSGNKTKLIKRIQENVIIQKIGA